MPTDIASHNPGRSIATYDLLDEITDATGMTRADAHDAIHATLSQITDIDGEDNVILNQRPQRPELTVSNPRDLDIDFWISITDTAAQEIRDALIVPSGEDDE